jgi:hypothetical protein
VNTYLDVVKLQFLEYPYRLLEPFVVWEEIPLSSVEDIACTKLQTVSMRGSKKDFIDLYFLLQQTTLNTLLDDTKKKYAESDYSETHILKSLVYFDDADEQPIPQMHKDVSWEQVKKQLSRQSSLYQSSDNLLGELTVPQVEHLLESILKTYERLKELGFTYCNGKIVVIDTEEVNNE